MRKIFFICLSFLSLSLFAQKSEQEKWVEKVQEMNKNTLEHSENAPINPVFFTGPVALGREDRVSVITHPDGTQEPYMKPKMDAVPIIVVGLLIILGGFLVTRR